MIRMPAHPNVLVVCGRPGSWGTQADSIGRSLAALARMLPEATYLLPLDPGSRATALPWVTGLRNVVVTDTLSHADLELALVRSDLVLTDAGGIQEQASGLGKAVLVMRETAREWFIVPAVVSLMSDNPSAPAPGFFGSTVMDQQGNTSAQLGRDPVCVR